MRCNYPMPAEQSRRQFLKSSSTVALGLGIAPWISTGCRNLKPSPSAGTRPEDFRELAKALQGSLLQPGAPDFSKVAAPWNLRYLSSKPAAIARCVSVEDIRTSLLWAQAHKVPLV